MKEILKPAGVVSLCILLSRVLGLVRDILCASYFGASRVWDAFVIAFIIPNLFRRLFGEGSLSAAFIPVYSESLEKNQSQRAETLFSSTVNFLFIFLSSVACVIALLCAVLPLAVADSSGKFELICQLLKIMLPFLPLVCVVAIISAALNCHRHFVMPALASVILNITWIAGVVLAPFLTKEADMIYVVAFSISIGGILELILQIPALAWKKVLYKFKIDLKDEGVKRVISTMAPTVLAVSVVEINIMMDNIIVEVFVPGDGGVSALYYASRVMQFPLALIGIALSIVAFPDMSRHYASGNIEMFTKSLKQSLKANLFFALPASIGLAVLSKEVIELLFKFRKFTDEAAFRSSLVLIFYSAGIWIFCLNQILTRAFYSIGDPKTPLRLSARNAILNIILNIIFVQFLNESGVALSTTLCSAILYIELSVRLRKKMNIVTFSKDDTIKFTLRVVASSLLMGAFVYGAFLFIRNFVVFSVAFKEIFVAHQVISRLVTTGGAILCGILFYLVLTSLLIGSFKKSLD